MISAVFASRSGDDVTVFEKNDRTCKKIYITEQVFSVRYYGFF